MNPKPIESLLLQMGFCPEDFNSIRRASSQEEAAHKLESLKARFKLAFRKKIPDLHPDRTNGDHQKTTQLLLLIDFARELEATQIPQIVAPPRVTVYEVTFQSSPQRVPRSKNAWAGLPDEIRTKVTSNSTESTVASMTPSGVVGTRGR
jgi:hypothetical protein